MAKKKLDILASRRLVPEHRQKLVVTVMGWGAYVDIREILQTIAAPVLE